jgi:prephenate dehydrogenase
VSDESSGGLAREAAAAGLPDRIAFLGFGLIGGSIALALRAAGSRSTIAAWTARGRGPGEGLRRGIVDEAAPTPQAAIDGAGLVVLAGPPLAILDHLESLGGAWRRQLAKRATVTDVGSTKARIVAAADSAGLAFVGGHPMAGRETTGVESATAELFVDRPWVVTPGARSGPENVAAVEALATATGARPLRLAGDEHDAAVAAISHLPLLLSASLVEAVATGRGRQASWPLGQQLAASGWRDTTRLAKGDPEMGAGILATNTQPVADGLRLVRDAIDAWLEQLETPDPIDAERLRRRLEAARAALQERG